MCQHNIPHPGDFYLSTFGEFLVAIDNTQRFSCLYSFTTNEKCQRDSTACGQYHLNNDQIAKGGVRRIRKKQEMLGRKEDVVGSFDLEAVARALDDPRVEAQATRGQKPGREPAARHQRPVQWPE